MKRSPFFIALVALAVGAQNLTLGAQQRSDATAIYSHLKASGLLAWVKVPTGDAPGVLPITILGVALDSLDSPLPNAKLRLRNAQTGHVEALALSDRAGEFGFESLDPGSYVVELLDDRGAVLAASELVTVDVGETVVTLVKQVNRRTGVGIFGFGNTALAVIGSAAAAGVLAVAATGQPASPEACCKTP
jgi:hypothetical protein